MLVSLCEGNMSQSDIEKQLIWLKITNYFYPSPVWGWRPILIKSASLWSGPISDHVIESGHPYLFIYFIFWPNCWSTKIVLTVCIYQYKWIIINTKPTIDKQKTNVILKLFQLIFFWSQRKFKSMTLTLHPQVSFNARNLLLTALLPDWSQMAMFSR